MKYVISHDAAIIINAFPSRRALLCEGAREASSSLPASSLFCSRDLPPQLPPLQRIVNPARHQHVTSGHPAARQADDIHLLFPPFDAIRGRVFRVARVSSQSSLPIPRAMRLHREQPRSRTLRGSRERQVSTDGGRSARIDQALASFSGIDEVCIVSHRWKPRELQLPCVLRWHRSRQ